MTGVRSALLIATDHYEDESLSKLHAPAGDVSALAEVLANPEIGGYEVREPLINEPYHHIREEIQLFCEGRQRADHLLLYFSCHGLVNPSSNLYLAATNTKKRLLAATAVSARYISERMRTSRADQIVLVLDCCNGGAFGKDQRVKHGGDLPLREMIKPGRGRIVLAASSSVEFAFEDNKLNGRDARSVFTAAIVDGLATGAADVDRDGLVSERDLFEYAERRVQEQRPEQTPCRFEFDVAGRIVLARRASTGGASHLQPHSLLPTHAEPFTASAAPWFALQHEMPRLSQASSHLASTWDSVQTSAGSARVRPLLALAASLKASGELATAEDALRAALALPPSPSEVGEVRLALAAVLDKRGRVEEAKQEYRAAARAATGEKRRQAWRELGQMLVRRNDTQAAVSVWQEAAQGGEPLAWIWLGELHERDNDWAQAVFAYESAASAGIFDGFRKLAALHQRHDQHAKAVQILESLLALAGSEAERDDRLKLARAAKEAGLIDKAASAYRTTAEAGNHGAWIELGEMLEKSGDITGALRAYATASGLSKGARFSLSKRRAAKRGQRALQRLGQLSQ